MNASTPLVGILMGSKSDWEAMKQASDMLTRFGVPHESKVMSAHRTPAVVAEYASGAAARGVQVIIAGAGGAAHLAGVVAAHTILPVVGVPMQSAALNGIDSLLSTQRHSGRDRGHRRVGRGECRFTRCCDSGHVANRSSDKAPGLSRRARPAGPRIHAPLTGATFAFSEV